jgi:hypothetical protein
MGDEEAGGDVGVVEWFLAFLKLVGAVVGRDELEA